MADQAEVELTYAEAARLCTLVTALREAVVELTAAFDELDENSPEMAEAEKAIRDAVVQLEKEKFRLNVISPDLLETAEDLLYQAQNLGANHDVSDEHQNASEESQDASDDDLDNSDESRDYSDEIQQLHGLVGELIQSVEEAEDKALENLWKFLSVDDAWREILLKIFKDIADVFEKLGRKENFEIIYPPVYNLFSWTRVPGCGPKEVKIAIIGQDPVADDKATGIAFVLDSDDKATGAVGKLLNLALKGDSAPGCWPFQWCKQGVLMINNVFTIGKERQKMETKKHNKIGWQKFTRNLVHHLCAEKPKKKIVFIQLGTEVRTNLLDVMEHWTICITNEKGPIPKTKSSEDAQSQKIWGECHISLTYYHPASRNGEWEKSIEGNNFFELANNYLQLRYRRGIAWSMNLRRDGWDDWDKVVLPSKKKFSYSSLQTAIKGNQVGQDSGEGNADSEADANGADANEE